MPSIFSALQQANEQLSPTSDSPFLDAEVLLCLVMQQRRSYLKAWPEKLLTAQQLDKFNALVNKRVQGFPVAYLTGVREFWSREFRVTPDVLIPRPETELLIELALEIIPQNKKLRVIDLGTGSGAIAITLAAERPAWQVTATDISKAALEVAQQNAERLKISNICFRHSHWFAEITDSAFDLVISNPPYIAPGDLHLQQGDLRFEPESALISQQQGLEDITVIAASARRHLSPGGYLMVEHGFNQQSQVQTLFKQYHYHAIETHSDLAGLPRVTVGQWRKN